MKTIIIGGVAGGASAAARLRRLSENHEILIIEKGPYISFANCGLPYFMGGDIKDKNDLILQTPMSFYKRFNIDVRTNTFAHSVNAKENTLLLKNLLTGEEYTEKYDNLILSPGALPVKPQIKGIEKAFTLRTIPDTEKILEEIKARNAKTAIIVGGGYIGTEIGENLSLKGLRVKIIELGDHIVPTLDFEMAAEVQAYVRKKGIELFLNSKVTEITDNGVMLGSGEEKADIVIMSAGVRPDTDFLRDSAVNLTSKGLIKVDDRMRTNIPIIYAVGDAAQVSNFVTGQESFIPLAGPANKQGRIAADNICGLKSSYKGTQGSSVIKLFDMTAATTGISETAAKKAGLNFDKTYTYSMSHASYYPGAKGMSLKLLWERDTHKILGAQIAGFDGVDKRMDVIAAVIRLGGNVSDLTELELCYAPPFGSAKEAVNMAGFTAENVITEKVKQFFWNEVDCLPRDGSVFLLDVRTEKEVKSGSIEGFVNIPLDSLRSKMAEIPRDKPVYIHCHSGLRSYIACMMLKEHTQVCYNLAGGYRLYQIAKNEMISGDYPCYTK